MPEQKFGMLLLTNEEIARIRFVGFTDLSCNIHLHSPEEVVRVTNVDFIKGITTTFTKVGDE